MKLAAGTKLLHYEVLATLGVGGMGEVYRARDHKLGRQVALKVLPAPLGKDRDSLMRFEREARVLASLDHPAVGAIYDFQEENGTRFLVMQLVEGPTLEERLRDGAMPLQEVLSVFLQIAQALEAAHGKGVVHRDLKPANVKLNPGGGVKVLDFGLAKAIHHTVQEGSTVILGSESNLATVQGTILGTAAYMSPEQARGKEADARADIWAFGCCLYEALTGQRVFSGETLTETLVEVLQREFQFQTLPSHTPHNVRLLIRRCLERDRSKRLQSIADARIEIEETIDPPSQLPPVLAPGRPSRRLPRLLTIVAAALLGAAATYVIRTASDELLVVPAERRERAAVRRVDLLLPAERALHLDPTPSLAISPDARELLFAASDEGAGRRLVRRRLDTLTVEAVAGTDGARVPFYSGDGSAIGFFSATDRSIKRLTVGDGATLDLGPMAFPGGGHWEEGGSLLFSANLPNLRGLSRLRTAGEQVESVTIPDAARGELLHLWPQVLPGGGAVLYTVWRGPGIEQQQVAVTSFETGEQKQLMENAAYGRYAPTGHLLYLRSDGLHAVAFDPEALALHGEPAVVVDDLLVDTTMGSANLALAPNGTLAYVPRSADAFARRLRRTDAEGGQPLLDTARRAYRAPRLSPQEDRLAITISDLGPPHIELLELAADVETAEWTVVPFDGPATDPVWRPDGEELTVSGNLDGSWSLYSIALDDAMTATRRTEPAGIQVPASWSPDGSLLAFVQMRPDNNDWDIWILPAEAEAQAEPFIVSPAADLSPTFSPRGDSLAFVSDESGRYEVYVKGYPGPSPKVQVSAQGGVDPVWGGKGRSLYYRTPAGELVRVQVEGDDPLQFSEAEAVASGLALPADERAYDVLRSSGAIVSVEPAAGITRLRLVFDWFAELERLAPPRATPNL